MNNPEVCSSYTHICGCFVFNVKFSLFLGIYPGTLSCIVKLPDEVGVSHTKCIEDTETILQLEKLSAAHWFILLKTFLKDNFLKYSVIVITDQKEPFWSAILTNHFNSA